MFNKSDITRNEFMLKGRFAKEGYDWWWHSFTGYNKETKEEQAFFIEFFTCNPSLAKDKPVLGQDQYNKENGIRPSYVMVKVGAWGKNKKQLHRFFAWKDAKIHTNAPYSIEVDDCIMSETFTKGSVHVNKEEIIQHPEYMCDAGDFKWNLKINKKIPFNVGYGAGKLFRSLQLFEMFWHAEGMKTAYQGEIEMDGITYVVDEQTSYGYADKNWGKDFTSPWVWLSSCDLYSTKMQRKLENSVFDIGGGCPKIGFIALKRKLLSAFYYEEKCFEFNFSKFWTNTKTIFECHETNTQIVWHVEQTNWTQKMVADITCEKEDMLLINYEAPSGLKKHNRLWNGGNGKGTIQLYEKNQLIDTITCEHIGCEYGEIC